jgi:hypothetical protein
MMPSRAGYWGMWKHYLVDRYTHKLYIPASIKAQKWVKDKGLETYVPAQVSEWIKVTP